MATYCEPHSKTFKRGLTIEQFGKNPDLTKQKMSYASKGKKWEERYGVETSSRLKNNLSFKFSGRTISDEWRGRISTSNIGKLTGDRNPMRKSEVVAKLKNTFEKIGLRIPDDELTNFELYRRKVRECSENEFKKHKNTLLNSNFRGKEFDLDHKFSIFEGFKQGVPVWIIGSIQNLEMLNSSKNRQKHVKCTVSLDILAENVFSNIRKESRTTP